MSNLPPVYFYLPESNSLKEIPQNANNYWVGFRRGIYSWTLQTYLRLRENGFPCQLVGKIPKDGIVFAHRDSLPQDLQPGEKLLIVCFQADRARHPYAQIHIVQNPQGCLKQLMVLGDRYLLPGGIYYMPHWTQPGLIPRSSARGTQFETVAFFGLQENLVPELQSLLWQEQLQALGLRWQVVSNFEHWHNYSEVDVILAVRSFAGKDYTWKPATKLYNAWHAGVPAILGCESAYRAERQSSLDYLEVKSLNDIVSALKLLKENVTLRQAMVENGKIRAQETQPAKLVARWHTLLVEDIVPQYEAWISSRLYRLAFLERRRWATQTRNKRKKLQQLRNRVGIRSSLRALISRTFKGNR